MATNGITLITPTSVAVTGAGSSASINAGGSVTFATAATLSLNGVFSSLYDNYIVDLRFVGSVNQQNLNIRLRLSGTDASGSNYTRQFLSTNGTSINAVRETNFTQASFSIVDSEQRSGLQGYIYGPSLAQPTAMRTVGVSGDGNARTWEEAITHSLSTAYDGFTLISAASNFTGLIKVYGLVQ
jgi:hypothetical protein